MRSFIRYTDEVPTPAVRVPSYNFAFLPHFRDMPEADFIALAESKPLRRNFCCPWGAAASPRRDEQGPGAAPSSDGAHVRDAACKRRTLVVGSELTLADIAIMPVLVRMADLGLGTHWEHLPRSPGCSPPAARPAFSKTFYLGRC